MTIATQLRETVDQAKQEISRQGGDGNSPGAISVNLSKVQRKYLAELRPKLAESFAIDQTGMRSVALPIDSLIELAAGLELRKQTESGSRKNAATKSLKAIEKATLEYCDRLTRVGVVYRLRIELNNLEPAVWRRIEIPDCTLFTLHDAIQSVMGWDDDHMFAFSIGGTDYYGSPMGGSTGRGQGKNAEKYTLSDVMGNRKGKFNYEYDFGDSWNHTILVEDVSTQPVIDVAKCLAGENACPPEDCGGIYGYYELCEALRDPDLSADDDERLEWYEDFDPTSFEVDRATGRLRHLFD
jgi:hypothetical protein